MILLGSRITCFIFYFIFNCCHPSSLSELSWDYFLQQGRIPLSGIVYMGILSSQYEIFRHFLLWINGK